MVGGHSFLLKTILVFNCFSVMVSAKQGDNSVAMAIQSLIRHILEKQNLPRKWRPVEKPVKEEKKPDEIPYDKLKMTGIEKVRNFTDSP